MSALEAAAKPVLMPMILGKSTVLGTPDQCLAARWAFKTALVLYAAEHQPPDPIPRSHIDHLWQRVGLPDPIWVWIGAQDATDAGYWLKPVALTAGGRQGTPNGYWITLSVGNLLFQILGAESSIPEYLENDLPAIASVGMVRLQPAKTSSLPWPHPYAATHKASEKLREAFAGIEPLILGGPCGGRARRRCGDP